MSDSILLSTGYATITREIMKRLAKEYDVTHFGWQFVGNPLKFYPDEETVSYANKPGGIKLLPNPGSHPFGANMLQHYLRLENPDLFWCLCDSLSEDRIVILKNKKNEIEFLTMKEAYEKYGPEPKGIKTLSVQVHRAKPHMVKLKDLNGKWHDACSKRTINRGIWTELRGITRRYVTDYDMRLIFQTLGETECSEKHSLVYDNGEGLKEITPKEFIMKNEPFVKLDTVPDMRTSKTKKMDIEKQFDYARIFGAFVSEGCISSKEQVIFSNKNKEWLENIRQSMQRLFNKKGSYTHNKKDNVYNLVFWGKELYSMFENWCGKYARNKKVPNMVFGFRKDARIEFLTYAIKGDGSFIKHKGTRKMYKKRISFKYTTISPKLIAGLSFLLTKLQYNYSIRSYQKKSKVYEIGSNSNYKRTIRTGNVKRKYNGFIYDLMTENEIFLDGCGLIATHNSFMLYDWINNIDFAPAKSMFYFPSDGEYFPFGCENVLKKFQYVIAMSKFAQSQIKRLFNIDVDYIPHGIDTEFFKPADEVTKRQLRDKWSPRLQTDLQDKFVITSVGRNQGRKALPEFLKVLGRFVKGKEDKVRIILHCLKSDMPVIIKDKDKMIDIIPIRDLVEWKNEQNLEIQDVEDLEIFDGKEFTQINKIQRRLSEDKMLRINTCNGLIDVTEEHYLFEEDERVFERANTFKEGDKLLTSSFNKESNLLFSEDLAWLIGFFVAEGSAGKYLDKKKNSFFWEFHIDNKKKEYLDNCAWTLKKYFDCKIFIKKNKDNVYRLTTNKTNIIAPLFLDYCYTKSNHKKNLYKEKRIPKIILNCKKEVQFSFFDGYYCGDGINTNKEKQYYGFTTNSKTLAMGLVYLIRRLDLGIINIFSEERISKNGKYNSYYKVFLSDETLIKERNKIKKIKELPYNKEWVYDIETESHKYATGIGDIIVHNCDPEDPAGIGPPQWLFSLLQRYGLEHVVRFSGTKVWFQFPFEDYREMYQIADIHALATCYHPDTEILTEKGSKKIKDIEIGEKVLSKDGKFNEVTQNWMFTTENGFIGLNAVGQEEVKLTPNHRIFIERNNKIEKIQTKDAKIGDYVMFPRLKKEEPLGIDFSYFYKNGKNQFGKIFKHPREKSYGYYDIDSDLAKLFGYFIAEGCASRDSIKFCLNQQKVDDEIRTEIIRIMKDKFNLNAHICNLDRNRQIITFYSSVLSRGFRNLFGNNAKNKHMSNMIYLRKEEAISLLKGLWQGDGHIGKDKRSNSYNIEYQTVSKNLAKQMQILLNKIGIPCSLKSSKRQSIVYRLRILNKKKEILNIFKYNYVNFRELKNSLTKVDDDYIYYRIRQLKIFPYVGNVFDLTVASDHSYTTSFVGANTGEILQVTA